MVTNCLLFNWFTHYTRITINCKGLLLSIFDFWFLYNAIWKFKAPARLCGGFPLTGNNLSSRAASSQVLSTRESLTAVFGMGTGGPSQPSSPDLWMVFSVFCCVRLPDLQNFTEETTRFRTPLPQPALSLNQALDWLVPVRSIHCCTYTPGLSTSSSSRCLTGLRHERSHLEAGFTLRCFQRLSVPDVATQRYAWRHNWYTIDPSTPVLSY